MKGNFSSPSLSEKNVFKATNLSNLQRNLWVEQCPHRHTTRICSVYSILGLA